MATKAQGDKLIVLDLLDELDKILLQKMPAGGNANVERAMTLASEIRRYITGG